MTFSDSQQLETYVPVYDVIPEKWEDARAYIIEQQRRMSDAINIREIGWFLDEEVLTGKAFVPGTNTGGTSQQYRSILRKVIVFPGLTVGANTQPHGLTIDGNFTLIAMYGAATNATLFTGEPLPNGGDTVRYNATNVIVTVASAYTRAVITMEYIQEL